jgi:murein DD-endopeptidase MepM/ murein hydrolase activator NlpD
MTTKHWPVPDSESHTVPSPGDPGSFWEDRDDRRHCGVDIYAPSGSPVHAVEVGRVLDTGVMTSKDLLPYWNTTYYVLIQHGAVIAKYAELRDVTVSTGDEVNGGTIIGLVGTVLDYDAITENAPAYIQHLGNREAISMLHFELYRALPMENAAYLGGNWLGTTQPDTLLDPTSYLRAAAHNP